MDNWRDKFNNHFTPATFKWQDLFFSRTIKEKVIIFIETKIIEALIEDIDKEMHPFENWPEAKEVIKSRWLNK